MMEAGRPAGYSEEQVTALRVGEFLHSIVTPMDRAVWSV